MKEYFYTRGIEWLKIKYITSLPFSPKNHPRQQSLHHIHYDLNLKIYFYNPNRHDILQELSFAIHNKRVPSLIIPFSTDSWGMNSFIHKILFYFGEEVFVRLEYSL